MARESRQLGVRLTRRQFMQGAAVASSAVLFARFARLARALDVAPPAGFLTEAELRFVDAYTALLFPSGTTPGAQEAGVTDYIQGLLSVFPGVDANADGRTTAADITAVIDALGTDEPSADADGNGIVDADDVALTQRSIFGTALAGEPSFDGRPLFAGGPFSGRTPFPDPNTGTPSNQFPANSFLDPLPLPRVKRLAWTARLLGAAAVPELADNPLATTLPDVDLRRRYREGIAQVNALAVSQFGMPFDELDTEKQEMVRKTVRRSLKPFNDLLTDHTIEGLLCAPEYGGNRDGIGWQVTRFDGDSQPLGYTIFDATIDDYRERPDKPNSTLDPDDDCSGFSDAMSTYLRFVLTTLAGATEFPDSPCYRG